MAVVREDPYAQFNFLVSLGQGDDETSVDGGFSEVSGLGAVTDIIEYRTGNSAAAPRKLSGVTRYPDVTLTRGVIGSLSLWNWVQKGQSDVPLNVRSDVTITLLDETRNAVMAWRLRNARPVAHLTGAFDANGREVAIEQLVIAHEHLDIV